MCGRFDKNREGLARQSKARSIPCGLFFISTYYSNAEIVKSAKKTQNACCCSFTILSLFRKRLEGLPNTVHSPEYDDQDGEIHAGGDETGMKSPANWSR